MISHLFNNPWIFSGYVIDYDNTRNQVTTEKFTWGYYAVYIYIAIASSINRTLLENDVFKEREKNIFSKTCSQ